MNETYYEKNKEALKQKYPKIFNGLKNFEKEEKISAGVAQVEDRLVLYVIKDGKQYQLDSLYDEKPVLDCWFESLGKIQFKNKIIIFGLGNGMYARKFLRNTNEDTKVIVYEPSASVLQTVMENFDISDLLTNKRMTFIAGVELKESVLREKLYENIEYTDIKNMIVTSYLNYIEVFTEEYAVYFSELQNTFNAVNSSQDVVGRYGHAYYENTIYNFRHMVRSKSLENLYDRMKENPDRKEIPAIVVAAGPSLDKNIDELKAAKGRAFIIAVDSAVNPLLKHGIIPDIAISIDGYKMTAHFERAEAKKIPLICYLISRKEIVAAHQAPLFFMNDLNSYAQKFMTEHKKLLPMISSGGSVANDAFSIAKLMGFSIVIMIGQDLAYTNDKTHSSDSVRGSWNEDVKAMETLMVDGINGERVPSSKEFNLYRLWFEEQIVKYSEMTIIDATEGGALIQGTRILTLKEAIEEFCIHEENYEKLIAQTDDFFAEDEKTEFVKYVLRIPEEMEKCRKQIEDGIRLYDKMLEMVFEGKYHSKSMVTLFEKAKEIGEKLEKNPVMEYVQNRIQELTTSILRDIYEIEDDEKTELVETCKKGRNYLEIMQKELNIMIPECTRLLSGMKKMIKE